MLSNSSVFQHSSKFSLDSLLVHAPLSYFCFSFAKGCRPGYQTGFDIDDADLRELEQFHGIIVASAIFGTSINNLLIQSFPCLASI